MTDQDVVHESALSDLRHGLLTHPETIKRLKRIASLRSQWLNYGLASSRRYMWDLLERTEEQLDHHFGSEELLYLASVVRERIESGIWGKAIPVGRSGDRYGRHPERVRTVAEGTVAGAVEALARRLTPEQREPNMPPEARRRWLEKRRTWRRRLRKLASS